MTGRAILRAAATVVVAGSAWACGGSTTTPSPPALSLGGTWTGTWTFVAAGATVVDTVTLTLSQSGGTAAGQWSASSGPGGTISFPVGDTIAGATSISQTIITGPNCFAETTVTGTATATSLKFTLGPLTNAGLCQWAASHQFAFTR